MFPNSELNTQNSSRFANTENKEQRTASASLLLLFGVRTVLLEDFGDNTCTDGATAFANGKAHSLFNRDRVD